MLRFITPCNPPYLKGEKLEQVSKMKQKNFNPAELNRLDGQRLANYRTNLDFYRGSQWQKDSKHRQLVFNYAKVSIDKVTSFLMQGLNFSCYPSVPSLRSGLRTGPGEETDEIKARVRRAEQLLLQVHDRNNLQQLDYETEIDTAILGDGCYKVTWDADEKRIRITAPDVSGLYAWWLGDDTARVWRVASRYNLTQDEIAILYGQAIEKKAATITELWTARDFELYLDNDIMESRPNPYGFIPFIIFPKMLDVKVSSCGSAT